MKPKEGSKSIFAAFIEALRKDRRLELTVYALLLGAALIIFSASGGISCTGSGYGCRSSGVTAGSADRAAVSESGSSTEKRLASILEGISGAGRVEVMISFYDTGDGYSAVSGSADETRLQVRGVIVLAEGADSIRVRTDIQTAVRTLLGIDSARIGVYKLDKLD